MRTCCLFGARKMNGQAWSYLTASKHQEYNNTRRNTRRRRVGRSVWNIIKKMFPFENLQVRGSFCSISISAQRLGIFVIRSSKQSREKLEKLKERPFALCSVIRALATRPCFLIKSRQKNTQSVGFSKPYELFLNQQMKILKIQGVSI